MNPFLGLLEVLRALRSLHVELVTVGGSAIRYLPEYLVFQQLTHLHLKVVMDITFPVRDVIFLLLLLSLMWGVGRKSLKGEGGE